MAADERAWQAIPKRILHEEIRLAMPLGQTMVSPFHQNFVSLFQADRLEKILSREI